MAELATHQAGEIKYVFKTGRLCWVKDAWERRPGRTGVRPFGAETNDYFEIKQRQCHACQGWAVSYGRNERYSPLRQAIIICRCRTCNHGPFEVGVWLQGDRAQTLVGQLQEGLIRGREHNRKIEAGKQFDDIVETMQIAVDFMDSGRQEDAKFALCDRLRILQEAGLLKIGTNTDTRA